MDGSLSTQLPSPSSCLSCGALERRQRFPAVLPWVVECTRCSLVFAEPQPSDEELKAIYDEHYYEQFGFVEGAHANDAGLARMKKATYGAMLDLLPPGPSGRRLLDVGCGLGFSLLAAQERGFEAIGIDPLAPTDATARPGRRIVRASLETFSDPRPFDVVSMIDVIEHVRDPVGSLGAAASLLRAGGTLLVATNDSSSPGARALGPRWTHYHRAHLWFFTPATLSEVARRAGLRVVRAAPARRTYNLEYIASILARGSNFEAAARLARVALRITPGVIQRAAWPPVPEGFVLALRRAATD